jgi:hypothetical protein
MLPKVMRLMAMRLKAMRLTHTHPKDTHRTSSMSTHTNTPIRPGTGRTLTRPASPASAGA